MTDSRAIEVVDSRISPADVIATLLAALGGNPESEVYDRQGRPIVACPGSPIDRVYSG